MGLLLAAFVALTAVRVHAAPESNATCIAQQWTINSIQQTPCLVSAFLSAQCTSDNSWMVQEIGTDGPYSHPEGDYANVCRCNSVQWNLLSACSVCQGGPSGTWSDWISNCSASVRNVGTYPLPVPQGAVIPHWAYYDFTTSNVFNVQIAQQQTGAESSAPISATSSPTSASGAYTSGSTQVDRPTTSPRPSNANNTGAIVGGVVGGILGLALIAIVVFVIVRKSKSDSPNKGHYAPSTMAEPTLVMGQHQSGMPYSDMPSPGFKPYNPSDPSTFPEANNAPSQYSQSLHVSHNATQYRPGQYSGAPEV